MLQDSRFKAMVSEIEASSDLYRPSKFWDHLNTINESWLDDLGLDNFKRTVAQNYYNWLIISHKDPQFRRVVRRWLSRPSLAPLLTRLEIPELIRTTDKLENRFGRRAQLIYRLFVSFLWELAIQDDRLGLTARLEEPTLGRPIEIRRGGRLISQDLANSIREANTMARFSAPFREAKAGTTIAELGAGYGRVGYACLSHARVRYFIFDIPPALHVSQWYLSRLFPDRKIFQFRHFADFNEVKSEVDQAELAFFTPNQMALFPDGYFDVFCSISTLPEMSKAQITNYLTLMSRLSRGTIYLKQWRHWFNDKDSWQFTYDQLVLPESWTLMCDETDAVQPLFQERVWARLAT